MNQTTPKTKMTRRDARKEDRREAILTVASQSFLEHGYAATSMSAIAAELGGSKGTLWSYFPSKEELFTAVIDQRTIAFRRQLQEILEPTHCVEQTLRNVCVSLLEKVTSPEAIALNRIAVGEAGRFPELGEIFYNRGPRMSTGVLADYLEGAMQRGELRKDDPTLAARTLIALCIYVVQQKLLLSIAAPPDEAAIEAEADCTMAIFMRAFAPE
tara:strand:+ start:993 stop:1634 length:642 start_codon:yes stop_codon:yes gene_type:complete